MGKFQIVIEGEDGSVLRVPLPRPTKAHPNTHTTPDAHLRAAAQAREDAREARRARLSLRSLRGLPGCLALSED